MVSAYEDSLSESMINSDELEERLSAEGIKAFGVSDFFSKPEDFTPLSVPTIEELVRFMKAIGNDVALYQYDYVSINQMIDPDVYSDLIDEDDEELAELIDSYNDGVEECMYEDPAWLYVFCMYNGRAIGVELENPDYEEIWENPDEALLDILESIPGDEEE